jgi:hypothetical protein
LKVLRALYAAQGAPGRQLGFGTRQAAALKFVREQRQMGVEFTCEVWLP